MDFFDMAGAQGAYDQFSNPDHPRHHVTHELVAGAAGFEAMRMFEQHRVQEGQPVHHALAKEMLAGFAAAEIDKHFEGDLLGHLDRDQARDRAQQQAGYLYDQQYDQGYGDQGYGQY